MPSIIKAKTLSTFKNKLDLPEGSLIKADNVIIDQDNILMPRRGFAVYGTSTPCCVDIKAVFPYKKRILRHYGSTLQYDCCCNSGTFSSFSGSYSELESGLRMKSVESNSNLYFTTTDGIKKISGTLDACCNTNFTTGAGFITSAGGVKALDLTGTISYCCGAFLTTLSKTAYRMVWGIRDKNNTLIIGAPSSRLVVTNTSSTCSANVCLTGTIPSDASTTCHFYQLFRTGISKVCNIACINCAAPGDCMNLIIEKFITTCDIAAGQVTVQDTVPDCFRASGALLYTNPQSGEGILQANDKPPVAKDVARFRNSVFFANTSTVQRKQFSMLSTSCLTSGQSKITIGNCCSVAEYTFTGATEVSKVFVIKDTCTSMEGDYFLASSASNERNYGFYYCIACCTCVPCAADTVGRTMVPITIVACDTPATIACKSKTAVAAEFDFTATCGSSTVVTPSACISTACNSFTKACHGFIGGEIGQFTTSCTLPTGISATTDYYVVCVVCCTFKVSTAFGGCAVCISVAGVGCQTLTSQFFTITNIKNGNATSVANGLTSTNFTFCVTAQGDGEAANTACGGDVLLSSLVSASQSIDETARSLVNIVNRDTNGIVNAFYLSGEDDLPGVMLFESRNLSDGTFYIGVQDDCTDITGKFSPTMPNSQLVTSFASVCTCTRTRVTLACHGYAVCDPVFIYKTTNCTCGAYTVLAKTCCTFDVLGTLTETCGRVFKACQDSDNDVSQNRLYFSKQDQPEAVPITNWIDIGGKDKKIERIVALRDNLFALKEDGIYVVTGDVAPAFTCRLLDCSANILAPDTATVLNNQIYVLTTQGVTTVSDTGVGVVSRNIEDEVLKVTNDQFTFKAPAFGISSESDRSYHMWLPTCCTDTSATQIFRYNTFNRSWVRWTKGALDGVVNPTDDKIYLAIGGKIHRERKLNDRTDYADQEFTLCVTIQTTVACSNVLTVSSTSGFCVGDAITQCQTITTTKFNRLLRKLDDDTGLDCNDYECSAITGGACLSAAMCALVVKIDADDCTVCYTSPTGGTFAQDKIDYNLLVCELNTSAKPSFSNYPTVSNDTSYEAVTTALCATNSKVTLNECLPWLAGPITRYEGIATEIQWAPQHFGDPSVTKQIPEGSIAFDGNNFYSATVSFATDLSKNFEDQIFLGRGVGTFGSGCFSCPIWGGCGTDVPLRTLVPKDKQRCRYIFLKFKHSNAREGFRIEGIGLTPRRMSTRGYKDI
jgi:hypothetical protein